jgi:hypothetical protein
LGYLDFIESVEVLQCLAKYPKMCKQGTAGKRKHVTLTVPQKLEIIRRLENSESQREVMASYDIGFSSMV